MTSEPKAPGAPAILLSWEEHDDANSAEVVVHVRLKVLTEGGLSAGTLDLPDGVVSNDTLRQIFFARTIHPDGSIVVFSGTPQNSTVIDAYHGARKIIAMPSVTVGSILEYGYHFANQNTLLRSLIDWFAPVWQVQKPYFVRSAHFSLKLPEGFEPEDIHWVANLPAGATLDRPKGHIELNLRNIPARVTEEYMPPSTTAFYNVRFSYYRGKSIRYWGQSGERMDFAWSAFDEPSRLLREAVKNIIQPGDNDETKLRRLYLAVEAIENTDLTRERWEREDKK